MAFPLVFEVDPDQEGVLQAQDEQWTELDSSQ